MLYKKLLPYVGKQVSLHVDSRVPFDTAGELKDVRPHALLLSVKGNPITIPLASITLAKDEHGTKLFSL